MSTPQAVIASVSLHSASSCPAHGSGLRPARAQALCRASTSFLGDAAKMWMAGTSPAMTEVEPVEGGSRRTERAVHLDVRGCGVGLRVLGMPFRAGAAHVVELGPIRVRHVGDQRTP